jgi:hypothetical protein
MFHINYRNMIIATALGITNFTSYNVYYFCLIAVNIYLNLKSAYFFYKHGELIYFVIR